ncbi:hypothetical protein, partial [Caldibacillus sp. 210928-DFI.2.22]|uniref:hypothetical protein n=1 Tax=Caldibacillus sp. 210928-DFI.2.22 TaxID=2883265 RepID=UPI001D085C33
MLIVVKISLIYNIEKYYIKYSAHIAVNLRISVKKTRRLPRLQATAEPQSAKIHFRLRGNATEASLV